MTDYQQPPPTHPVYFFMITKHSLKLTILLGLIVSKPILSQSLGAIPKTSKDGLDYIVTLPEDYSKNRESAPLLLFLHGGDGSNTKHHPKKYATQAGLEFPFLVVAPHCNSGCSWSSVNYDALLSEVLQEYNVDRKRIYITGYSMGGYGTWSAITKSPDWFTAASPICGGGNASTICKAKNLAIRAYHGDKDSITPYTGSKQLIQTLKDCDTQAELITIKGEDHWIWPELFQSNDFYSWFLTQSK